MESLKHLVLSNWHFMRWIRLIIGIAIAIHAFQKQDIISAMLAAFLLLQSILNAGCCGTRECELPAAKKEK